MLKALELFGFKSFAEKTRFEFPAGVTVVVGPNGSGKSNIVDAIKWVLGEQSAKSLRGKDMADVIFKGAGGRKPMNTAEATIVFDNVEGHLLTDSPEVRVTRRVYRSGEGEYLINGQACRLRDIKDMLRGTGVGTDAYSIIEQGKLDVLLSASAKDRRAIFEEAAGISRFKAKKIEAQRRLGRVDQNMVRLSDIVEEVENRLRAVRSQATKAQRYREYTERLQQLRTHVGRADWRRLSEQLDNLQSEIEELRTAATELGQELEGWENRREEIDAALHDIDTSLRGGEARIGRNRERIAARVSASEHERTRLGDLEKESNTRRRQLLEMTSKAAESHARLLQTRQQLEAVEQEHEEIAERVAAQQAQLQEVVDQIGGLREQTDSRRTEHMDLVRKAGDWSNQASTVRSQLAAAEATAERCRTQADQLSATLAEYEQTWQRLLAEEKQLSDDVDRTASAAAEANERLVECRQRLTQCLEELTSLQGRHSGAKERAAVLEELEERLEGLDAGVQQVLESASADIPGPYADVRGLVADLIQVHVETAPLVDIALGETAQHVVVAGERFFEALQSGAVSVPGRVGFVPLESAADRRLNETRGAAVDLAGQDGVIGRGDQMVETELQCRPLMRRLLGRVWLVEQLADARRLQQECKGLNLRFVTVAGELVESDGTIVVGPRQAALGLISRRSELRALRRQIESLGRQIDESRRDADDLQSEIDSVAQEARAWSARHEQASSSLAEHRAHKQAAEQRRQSLQQQRDLNEAELRASMVQRDSAEQELATIEQRHGEAEAAAEALESQIKGAEEQIEQLEKRRKEAADQAGAGSVELAKSEQRLEGLRTQATQLEEDQRERKATLDDSRQQLDDCTRRRTHAERAILAATSDLSRLYLEKEELARELVEIASGRTELEAERGTLAEKGQTCRRKMQKVEEKLHKKELAAGEIRHQRTNLSDRLREDYGIEVSELDEQPQEDGEQQQRDELDQEIEQLRRKINSIGAVNIDALEELEELEERFGRLSTQYQDLNNAKDSLERIISKINADSRRLFAETLETIRQNFQVMFRKVFGGGKADIVLEEGVDILEAGVEITAMPPGKQSLSMSLLSGGEKALTAVCLMLAIFQFRPSPFCVLDEVDGPLDEANIGRFVDQLKEFLQWTKFVIVTHSKKTMTAANTLYGVTMQESGVSKRVSVRFEDVTDDGHIRAAALERTSEDDERGAA